MSTRKTYRKYSAVAMAAAVAATGVVPVIAAAETEEVAFTDVSENNDHYDSIYALVEEGIITGMGDGTFLPEASIYRAQAANMFVRALKLEIPANVADVLEVYTDVNENSEYAEEIAAVTAAGIFGQFEEGKKGQFNAWSHINREQMASVLVRAYDLGDIVADKVDVKLDNVSPTHADNIQILANLDITKALEDFLPFNDVTRGQFASFLHRTIEKSEEEAAIVAEVNAFTVAHERVLGLVAVGDSDDLVKADDLMDVQNALDAFNALSDEAKERLVEAEGLLEDLQIASQNSYLFDVNTINGEGNMRDKLDVLNNADFAALSDEQKTEVAKLFIIKRNENEDKKFTAFTSIESTLNGSIAAYSVLLNDVNGAEDKEEMQEALEKVADAMGLEIAETAMMVMAEKAFDERPADGYKTVAEIIAVVN